MSEPLANPDQALLSPGAFREAMTEALKTEWEKLTPEQQAEVLAVRKAAQEVPRANIESAWEKIRVVLREHGVYIYGDRMVLTDENPEVSGYLDIDTEPATWQ